jgi:hypothetical protein
MLSFLHAPDRNQQCFSGLDVKADDEDHSDTLSVSFSDSLSSLSSDVTTGSVSHYSNSASASVAGSVTTLLSSTIANALTLSSHADDIHYIANGVSIHALDARHSRRTSQGRSDRMNGGYRSRRSDLNSALDSSVHIDPVDFVWLRERCEGDNLLVIEVLRTFCEQGHRHISGMQSSIKEMDAKMLLFHAVNFREVSF